jgi:transglutaminase-like putative cysteine protease
MDYEVPMKRCLLALLVVVLFPAAQSQNLLVPRAAEFEAQGHFREAAALLRSVAQDSNYRWTAAEQKELSFEVDRLRRIRLDYHLTRETLNARLERSVAGVTPAEVDAWIAGGKFDARVIDDTLRFLGVSVSNLFWRYPDIRERKIRRSDDSASEHSLYEACEAITRAARPGSPYVLPKKFVGTLRLTVDSAAVPVETILRAWMPVPRVYPYQKDFVMEGSSSPPRNIDDAGSLIRSAYFEQVAGERPVFWERFGYTRYGVHFIMDPGEVHPFDGDDTVAAHYLGEGPHVVFTEKIRKLCATLAGMEVNPLIKARRFYDWITENVLYSYSREYSTLRNISDYCLTNRYGDCGQHALLFITMCRANGIPARWQSGWYTFPGELTIHDWTEIYIAPYGWIPADPDMGIFAMRYFRTLTSDQRKTLRDFWFGGLDQYRMSANADHSRELSPVKRYVRSDNVDFQRGEIEAADRNIYFDSWNYHIENTPKPE